MEPPPGAGHGRRRGAVIGTASAARIAKTVIYRFARTLSAEIPLFPEKECNCLRVLAIARFGDRIGENVEENRFFGVVPRSPLNQRVVGSSPTGGTFEAVSL